MSGRTTGTLLLLLPWNPSHTGDAMDEYLGVQHGKSAAIVLDVEQYEALIDEIELIRDIRQARTELARGEGIPHEEVVTQLRERLKR